MTNDTTALQERIARALYEEDKRDAANAGLAFDSDAAWEWARDWTAAVLPIIAAEVRKAQAEAWSEGAAVGARDSFSADLTPNPYSGQETGHDDER